MSAQHELSVKRSAMDGEGLVRLELDAAGSPVRETYRVGGQYLMLRLPHEERARPIAVASAPHEEAFELLLKSTGPEQLEILLGLEGATVWCGAVEGPGFPLERLLGRPVWLFAAGSAIAPIRAALDQLLGMEGRPEEIHLVYGARREGEICFREALEGWRARGVDVTVTLTDAGPGWSGKVGRVQAHIPDPLPGAADVAALVCGQSEMMRDVTAALVSRGVLAERIFRNY